jgi:hypothetical protein
MDTDKRSFSVNTEEYYINQPTAANIRNSDLNYSKVYSKSLIEDIYTASEMRDILKRRGIIGPEYDKRAQELADMLEAAITDMYISTDDEKRKLAAEKASEIRNEIFQWNHRLNGPMSNTCEQIADDAKLEFLTSCIIVSDKDELVWKDHNQFLDETNQILQTRAKFEVMLYLQGLESDFLETVPEAVILKEIADKDIEEITEESKPVEKEESVKEEVKVEEVKAKEEVETKRPVNEKKDNELTNKVANEKKKAKVKKAKK